MQTNRHWGGALLLGLIPVVCSFAAPAPAPEPPKLRATLEPKDSTIFYGWHGLAFSPDGKILASAGKVSGDREATIKLWNVADAKELTTLQGPKEKNWIAAPVFSPDGKTLVSGDTYGLYLWDVAGDHTPTDTLNRFSCNLVFSPDGKTLASVSAGVDIWDMEKKQLRATKLPNLSILPNGLIYTPEGKLLGAERSGDKSVPLYDVLEEKKIATLKTGPDDDTACVAFSPDGKLFVTGTYHQDTICLWDITKGEPKARLKVEKQVCGCFAFNPKGTIMAASLRPRADVKVGTIALYDVASGKELAVLKGSKGVPTYLVFSPDGRTLASCAAYESTIRLWSIPDVIKVEKSESVPEGKK